MTFEPDSSLVAKVVPGLGYTAGALRMRVASPAAIVVHTSGSGPVSRFADLSQRKRHGWKSPLDAAGWIYSALMEYSGHYILDGESGEIYQCVPEAFVAEHVGHSHYAAYAHGGWVTHDTAWWLGRWPTFRSPLELADNKLWTAGTCNGNTIGVEVVPRMHDVRGPWSDAAWSSLALLLRDIGGRHQILLDRDHIVTHSDASPLDRSTHGAPWDPSPGQWTPQLLEKHLG